VVVLEDTDDGVQNAVRLAKLGAMVKARFVRWR